MRTYMGCGIKLAGEYWNSTVLNSASKPDSRFCGMSILGLRIVAAWFGWEYGRKHLKLFSIYFLADKFGICKWLTMFAKNCGQKKWLIKLEAATVGFLLNATHPHWSIWPILGPNPIKAIRASPVPGLAHPRHLSQLVSAATSPCETTKMAWMAMGQRFVDPRWRLFFYTKWPNFWAPWYPNREPSPYRPLLNWLDPKKTCCPSASEPASPSGASVPTRSWGSSRSKVNHSSGPTALSRWQRFTQDFVSLSRCKNSESSKVTTVFCS